MGRLQHFENFAAGGGQSHLGPRYWESLWHWHADQTPKCHCEISGFISVRLLPGMTV